MIIIIYGVTELHQHTTSKFLVPSEQFVTSITYSLHGMMTTFYLCVFLLELRFSYTFYKIDFDFYELKMNWQYDK